MKHLIRLLACGTVLAALAAPALPQGTSTNPTEGTAATQQDDAAAREAARIAVYTEFYNLPQTGTAKYDKGKEFIEKYPTPADQYFTAVKKYVTAYEVKLHRTQFYDALKASRFDDAFVAGKLVLVDSPDDLQVYYDLTRAGWVAATGPQKNTKNNAETVMYAQKTLVLANTKTIKTPKDQILADAYSALGDVGSKPEEEVSNWYKAAQTKALAKDAPTYFKLALAYQESEYAKADQAYRDISKTGTPDSPEVKTTLKTLQESTDRLIDALARAVTYATTPETASIKTDSMPLLTSLYKFRNKNKEEGLQPFIAAVVNKPLPVPGAPIDYFPPPIPVAAATPTTGGAMTPDSGTTMPPAGRTPPTVKPPTKAPAKKPRKKKGA